MKQFGLIRDIELGKEETWKDKVFITLDIDWAHDDVIRYAADIFSEHHIKVTWFVTHESPVLNELRTNPLFELGIHPNYNPLLLNGSYEKGKTAREILNGIMKIVPEASCVRSHSLTQNSILVDYYVESNFKSELNVLIPINSGIMVWPFLNSSGLTELPHIWEDDVHIEFKHDYKNSLSLIKGYEGLCILDFHPIHIFLNSSKPEHYNSARPFLKDFEKIKGCVNERSYGTRNFLKDLINWF
ncbi:MAG TPA: hypothetical protein VNX68_13135 [Nitrosopumilaceae archaeon]|nr:hypothetical protein [Nitrosopumilaceae archaeon]